MLKPAKQEQNERTVCAMRLRVYPKDKQVSRSSRWLAFAHKFRNETVAFLNSRRLDRATFIRNHPVLAKDWIPEEFSGNDAHAASLWLTTRLEAVRARVRLEGGIACSKKSLVPVMDLLSRGEVCEMEDAWLLRVPRTVLDQVLQDIGKTLAKAISDRAHNKKPGSKRKPAGFPGFRKYRYAHSVRLQVNAAQNAEFKTHWQAGRLFVPGLGALRFRDQQSLPKMPPKLMTLARDASGAWYVSFICVEGEELAAKRPLLTSLTLPLDAQGRPTTQALDLSMESLGVDASGKRLGRERHLKRQQSKLTYVSRSLARKKKGSRRWHKARQKVGALHVEVANLRELFLQAQAKALVAKSAIVCLEDFALAFLLCNKKLGASAHDAGFGRFRQLIEIEAAKLGHLVIKCGRFDASSKTCSCCGTIKQDLKLKDRYWTCSNCHQYHDRDENAAVNIRIMALKLAIAELLKVPETGVGSISPHPLHPDLELNIARGGLTALLEFYFNESRRGAFTTPGCDKAREARILPNKPSIARRERVAEGWVESLVEAYGLLGQ